MRVVLCALFLGLASAPVPVQAEDTASDTSMVALAGPSVVLSSSISINLPLTAADPAGRQAEEDARRRDLYQRSVRECELLLDSIAASCVVTAISVSTQVNSNPGQADYLYATSNITMNVALK